MNVFLKSLHWQFTKPNQSLSVTRILHGLLITSSHRYDPFYVTKLVGLYSINNDLTSARHLFDSSPQRTIYLWNYIIRAYARAQKFIDAFVQFKCLLSSSTCPDSHTFACVARACAERLDVDTLRILHCKATVFGFGLDSISGSAFVRCYSKLGFVVEARSVFQGIVEPDLVLWNAMISSYGDCGDLMNGIELFNAMQYKGIRPDGHTMVGLIVGLAADHGLICLLETIHGYCVKCGLLLNDHVSSVLVSMYSKFEKLDSAFGVFANLFEPDLVSWSAIITGFSEAGDHIQALMLFREMVLKGRRPDPVLLAATLSASAQVSIFGPGAEIHGYAVRHKCNMEVAVSSTLIDMYAKCGFMKTAVKVFKLMPVRNNVSFNVMISNLGLYGHADLSFKLFNEMIDEGFTPDETTFSGLLSACCHSGFVNEGREYFRMMKQEFGIQPKTEHYVHMVKLLGMNGELEEAYDMIKSQTDVVEKSSLWGALLTCCDVNRNHDLVKEIEEYLCENESKNCGSCSYRVMVSNAYADGGRWDNVKQLRVEMGGAKGKIAGISLILDSNRCIS